MNFLGHIYLSGDDSELIQANLYGDFFKGKEMEALSQKVKDGIQLHREIDHYIDTHPKVLELLRLLYPDLPKVAGIAVDLYFDHLLARKWPFFHQDPYEEFLQKVYMSFDLEDDRFPLVFIEFLSKMKEKNWLYYYQYHEGLEKMSAGVSSRISFANKLTDAPVVFRKFENQIEDTFSLFMEDAKIRFGINS